MLPSRLWRRRSSAGTSRRKLLCKAGWYHVSPKIRSVFVAQCNRQPLRQVDSSADGTRRMHSTWKRRLESELRQPLHRPPPEHTLRSNLHWRFLASVRLKRPLFANVSQSLAEEVSCLPQSLGRGVSVLPTVGTATKRRRLTRSNARVRHHSLIAAYVV